MPRLMALHIHIFANYANSPNWNRYWKTRSMQREKERAREKEEDGIQINKLSILGNGITRQRFISFCVQFNIFFFSRLPVVQTAKYAINQQSHFDLMVCIVNCGWYNVQFTFFPFDVLHLCCSSLFYFVS